MLDVQQEPYVRAGVVNSAINIYIALDDWKRARDLLAIEAKTSNTPHYYIGDLADVEEHLGNNERALELMAEAYEKAKGPASRFQWGYSYLDGLLRLTPDDTRDDREGGARRDRRARRAEPDSPPHALAAQQARREAARVEHHAGACRGGTEVAHERVRTPAKNRRAMRR